METHLRRLHGFEIFDLTFGEVDGTLLQLVRDPEEVVAVDDGGLAGRRLGPLGRLGPKSTKISGHEAAA